MTDLLMHYATVPPLDRFSEYAKLIVDVAGQRARQLLLNPSFDELDEVGAIKDWSVATTDVGRVWSSEEVTRSGNRSIGVDGVLGLTVAQKQPVTTGLLAYRVRIFVPDGSFVHGNVFPRLTVSDESGATITSIFGRPTKIRTTNAGRWAWIGQVEEINNSADGKVPTAASFSWRFSKMATDPTFYIDDAEAYQPIPSP